MNRFNIDLSLAWIDSFNWKMNEMPVLRYRNADNLVNGHKFSCTNIACLKNINFIFAVSISAMAEPKNCVCVCVYIFWNWKKICSMSAILNINPYWTHLFRLIFFCSLTFHCYLHFDSTCIHRNEEKNKNLFFCKLSKWFSDCLIFPNELSIYWIFNYLQMDTFHSYDHTVFVEFFSKNS